VVILAISIQAGTKNLRKIRREPVHLICAGGFWLAETDSNGRVVGYTPGVPALRVAEGRLDPLISVRDDIAAALVAGAPVVALESTVIAHGLPRPNNLDTALEMEAAVREGGATPATIGILEGKIVVGLRAEEIARLADASEVAKASSADLSA